MNQFQDAEDLNQKSLGQTTNVKVHVLLTERDFSLLQSLYENIVMTYSQLTRIHFANAKKPTVLNRLSKLERAGFISRERIPKMRLGLDDQAIGVVFQITKEGIVKLKAWRNNFDYRSQPIRIHPYTLHHDLILVDLAAALKKQLPGCQITNGKLVVSGGNDESGLEPDLILKPQNAKELWSVELELSDKSERRYRELVLRYRLSKDYARVLYFVGHPSIEALLTRVILNRNPQPFEKSATGKFYFSRAFEFINRPQLTPISNGVDVIGEKGGGP